MGPWTVYYVNPSDDPRTKGTIAGHEPEAAQVQNAD